MRKRIFWRVVSRPSRAKDSRRREKLYPIFFRVFGGLLWRPIEKAPEFYIKVAAGVIHGYSGEFQNKIPFNSSGYAPGIVPGIGYCYKRFCGEMILFGTAGAMWTVGMTVP